MSTNDYDPTKDNNPVKDSTPTVEIPFLENLNVNKKKDAKDIPTDKLLQKKARNIVAAKKTGVKKSGGTLSYKDSYTDAVASKWESKGGYDAYEKAAKAWNEKKYGTTEPTAKAKKFTGGSKTELAKEHTASQTKVERIEPKPIAQISTETQANNRLQQAIASANSSASLLSGVQTRREKRQANRQQRQADRQTNRDNKQASRDRQKTRTSHFKQAKKERRQDSRQQRGDKRFERKTGISMSGTPRSMPELDTGPGTYQGAQATKGSNLVKGVQAIQNIIDGKDIFASANKKTPSKPTKKSNGEFWGKSGPIK